jgi:hypothetical protein
MRPLLVSLVLSLVAAPVVAQTYQGLEEAPSGTRWIADRSSRMYYPVDCWLSARVPRADRLYFATESALKSRGFAPSAGCTGGSTGARLEDASPATAQPAAAPAVASAAAAPSRGENRHPRRGFWISGGLGYGSLGCDNCGGREGGLSGGLQLGGSLSQKVLLGGGTSGWTKDQGGATLSVGTLVALIRFYPSSTGGFFLLGGLGLGTIYAKVDGFGDDTETGGGALLGLGYDLRVGSNVSLTPFWNGFAVKTSNADANVGQIGLSVTVH